MGLDRNSYSGLGFAHPVVDATGQSAIKKKKPKKRKHNTARHHLKIKKNKKHREDWSCVDSSGKFYTCTPPRATPQSKMPSTLSLAQIPSQYVTTKGNHSLTSDIIN